MSHLNPIFAVWDDNAEDMATAIGELGVTVRQWRNRKSIPTRAWTKIIAAAEVRGHEISLEQFLPPQVAA